MAGEEGRGNGGDNHDANAPGTQVPGKDAGKGNGDEDILKEMRGWLMTVGTLFITLAFQAALQPPAWMRTVDFLRFDQSAIDQFKHPFRRASHAAATAPAMFAPSPGPSPQAAESTTSLSARALTYMAINAFTFATALSLVLLLLLDREPARAKRTMKAAAYMMVIIGFSVVVTFALGSSEQWLYTLTIGILILGYAGLAVHCVRLFSVLTADRRRTSERPAP